MELKYFLNANRFLELCYKQNIVQTTRDVPILAIAITQHRIFDPDP